MEEDLNAAITLVVLYSLSTIIVRIASTILRHTGLPDNIARLQSISALSGTGFTTSESELIVNFPIRRKVLVVLMILGNLGMASIAATVIVALLATDGEANAIINQIIFFIVAISLTFIVMTNQTLDKKLCDTVSWYLAKSKTLQELGFHRLYQISDNYSISEHPISTNGEQVISDFDFPKFGLVFMGIRKGSKRIYLDAQDITTPLSSGDTLVCYGNESSHRDFVHSRVNKTED